MAVTRFGRCIIAEAIIKACDRCFLPTKNCLRRKIAVSLCLRPVGFDGEPRICSRKFRIL